MPLKNSNSKGSSAHPPESDPVQVTYQQLSVRKKVPLQMGTDPALRPLNGQKDMFNESFIQQINHSSNPQELVELVAMLNTDQIINIRNLDINQLAQIYSTLSSQKSPEEGTEPAN